VTQAIPGFVSFQALFLRLTSQSGPAWSECCVLATLVCKGTLKEDCVMGLEKKKKK